MAEGLRHRNRGGHAAPVARSVADLTPDADPETVARAIALRELSVAPRTRAQLADRLARRGVPENVTKALLDRFEEVDLVDDEQFSRMWVRSRLAGRGLSKRALRHELRQRGVAEETAREAVDEITPDDEFAAARELVRRRLPAVRGDDPVRRTRRLVGMLARKGYGPAVAARAVRAEVAASLGPDADGEEDGPDADLVAPDDPDGLGL
jgi:regulatory protein